MADPPTDPPHAPDPVPNPISSLVEQFLFQYHREPHLSVDEYCAAQPEQIREELLDT